MTKEQLKDLKDTVTSPLAPGNAVIIMTVTLYFVGVVVDVTDYGVLLGGLALSRDGRNPDTLIGQAKLRWCLRRAASGPRGIIAFHWRQPAGEVNHGA